MLLRHRWLRPGATARRALETLRRPRRRRTGGRRAAFTLAELVVVLAIMGMLASMAIPRMSRGSEQAADAALAGDLNVVRGAIIHYFVEHRGKFPGPTALRFVEQLTRYSDLAGQTAAAPGGAFQYGPYLVAIPACPVGENAGSSTVRIDAVHSPPRARPNSGDGWVYNPNTGEFYANTAQVPQGDRTLTVDAS